MATMLHWLTGAKQAEAANGKEEVLIRRQRLGNVDERTDSSACVEPPETPAPVFAVRAFRHALFGTPQTTQRPQPRRHSTADNRPRNGESPKPTRPRIDRPKSANDANALMPPASPTKGILMTPGTAAAKKKNVTFGDHVVDNQEKRPLKSGLPDDCPGKFPSPWNKSTADGEKDAPAEKGRGRNKLTEALEQARDESRQRKGLSEPQHDDDGRSGSPARENECCTYWRREYEVYRTNTQREVKKLVKKYKAAKDYAQSKDDEASEARVQLQESETKAEALEEAVSFLTAQMKELEKQLREQPQPQQELQQQQKETEALVPSTQSSQMRDRPRDLQALLERRESKDRTASASTVRTNENDQLQRPSERRPTSNRRAEERGGELQQRWRALNAPATKHEDVGQQPEQKVTSKEGERSQPARTVRAPAAIAARRAAEHEQPQATDEPSKRSTIPARPRRQPSALTAASTARSEPQTQEEPQRVEPAPTATTNKTSPLPPESTDLFLPSEPVVYSPPPKAHKSTITAQNRPTSSHNHQQPTAESVADSPPPPSPPAHGPNTISSRPKRQDSGTIITTGTGTGTLKPMSANARSGSAHSVGGGGSNGAGEGERKVGRDGKEIDAARLEAARARIKARGREVS